MATKPKNTPNGLGFCDHGRIGDHCEDCAYLRAKAAGLPLGGPPPHETRQAAENQQDPAA